MSKDIVVLLILLFVSSSLVVFLNLNFLLATILHFGLPLVYLVSKNKTITKKVLFFSLPFIVIGWPAWDYISATNDMWRLQAGSSFKIFNVLNPQLLLWGSLWTLFTIYMYENLEKEKSRFNPKVKTYALAATIVSIVFIIMSIVDIKSVFEYVYLLMGLLFAIIPTIYLIHENKALYIKSLKMVPFFFIYLLVHEVVCLNSKMWVFNGSYIMNISLFGAVFPLEELVFWMILSPPVIYGLYRKFT